MRYESPLNADAFRRTSVEEGQRIRPLAGSAVGTTAATGRVSYLVKTAICFGLCLTFLKYLFPCVVSAEQIDQGGAANSRKQGLGQKKNNRWNNENFVNLAAEIANMHEGRTAADVLRKAHANAKEYISIYNPEEHQSKAYSRYAYCFLVAA
jgi:hypothetical protein